MNKLFLFSFILFSLNINASESLIGWEALPPYLKGQDTDYVEEMVMPFVHQQPPLAPLPESTYEEDEGGEAMPMEIAETVELPSAASSAHQSTRKTIVYTSTDGTEQRIDIPKDSSSKKLTAAIIGYLKQHPPLNERYPEFPAHCIEPDCPLPREKHGTCKNTLSLHAHLGVYCSKNEMARYPCPECKATRRYISALWGHYVEKHL